MGAGHKDLYGVWQDSAGEIQMERCRDHGRVERGQPKGMPGQADGMA